jgi:hypothetical protein
MSSAVGKYWSTIAVPCSLSCKILRPVVGTPGGSVGLVDAGEQPLDSLGAHVGEPDDTYIHGSDLRATVPVH